MSRRDGPVPWIFATRVGKPLTPKRVGKVFKKVLAQRRARALPALRSLSHYATHLLAENYVCAQVGHSKPTTILMYYAHWICPGQ